MEDCFANIQITDTESWIDNVGETEYVKGSKKARQPPVECLARIKSSDELKYSKISSNSKSHSPCNKNLCRSAKQVTYETWSNPQKNIADYMR